MSKWLQVEGIPAGIEGAAPVLVGAAGGDALVLAFGWRQQVPPPFLLVGSLSVVV